MHLSEHLEREDGRSFSGWYAPVLVGKRENSRGVSLVFKESSCQKMHYHHFARTIIGRMVAKAKTDYVHLNASVLLPAFEVPRIRVLGAGTRPFVWKVTSAVCRASLCTEADDRVKSTRRLALSSSKAINGATTIPVHRIADRRFTRP